MSLFDIFTPSAVLPGVYTIATLPAAAANQARYAYVTDLGGGPDMVISDGVNWKHIRSGVVTSVAVTTTITQTPLASPLILNLTASGFNSAANVNVLSQNLYAGYEFTLIAAAGVFGILGSIGLNLQGLGISGISTLLSGSWADYQYNGTTIIKLRGGSL